MSWEPRPLPEVTPETAPFWEAAVDGKFLLRECKNCGLVYYYPRALCPDCLSDEVQWLKTEGTGEIYSFTITRRTSGWPQETLPLVYAYVELDEGPRVITNVVDCDPATVEIGQQVGVQFVETDENDIAIPVFTPVDVDGE